MAVESVRFNYAPRYDPDITLTCEQEYSKLFDLVQAYRTASDFFCKKDCPCYYTG